MKLKQCLSLILCWEILFFYSPVSAGYQESRVEILSPNPVGSGARAMGMGGAFIAISDDVTAASWNPGGLIQLEKPEMSAVYGYLHREENNSFEYHPEFSGDQSIQGSDLNYLSAAYPFELGEKRRNMIVSLNYQQLYDFNREWYFDKNRYKQTGSLYALGLAYCAQITLDFSIGFTINYWGDFLFRNKWEQIYHEEKVIYSKGKEYTLISDKKEQFSFDGWNTNFGFLWRINEYWTLGGVVKTPFTANIHHTITRYSKDGITETPGYLDKLSMPLSYGIGIAYRFSDEFTISGDIYRTHWNNFPINADIDEYIDPITWFRIGAEYLIVKEKIVIPIRAGIFYDPAPAIGSPDDFYGVSFGTGINCKRFSFDIAYQFRFGNNVGHSMLQNLGFSQDVQEHTVYTSLIYYF